MLNILEKNSPQFYKGKSLTDIIDDKALDRAEDCNGAGDEHGEGER